MGKLIVPPEEVLEKLRPKHIDFDVLVVLVNRMDDHDDPTGLLAEITGRTMEEIMDDALKYSISLVKAKEDPRMAVMLLTGIGDVHDFVDYYRAAWLAGLCEGLEEKRGIEIPRDFHTKGNLFWDLDGASVQYVTDQRVLRGIDGAEESDKPHPLVTMASVWIDGYSVGLQFDALKEEMLAQA
jgi:hypothetical protein